MKNIIKVFTIIAMVVVIMAGMAGCVEKEIYTLTVVNGCSSSLNVNISLGSETWEGVLQTDNSKTITYVYSDFAYLMYTDYSITYGDNNKVKTGFIVQNKSETVTIKDFDL